MLQLETANGFKLHGIFFLLICFSLSCRDCKTIQLKGNFIREEKKIPWGNCGFQNTVKLFLQRCIKTGQNVLWFFLIFTKATHVPLQMHNWRFAVQFHICFWCQFFVHVTLPASSKLKRLKSHGNIYHQSMSQHDVP